MGFLSGMALAVQRIWRPLLVVLGYGALYVVLLALETVSEVAPALPLWFPVGGLSLAVLLLFGLGYLPLVLAGTLFQATTSGELLLWQAVVLSVLITGAQGGAAAWLRRQAAEPTRRLRFVQHFVATALTLPAIVSLFIVLGDVLAGRGGVAWAGFGPQVAQRWIGEATGYLSVTPLLLMAFARFGPAWTRAVRGAQRLWPTRQPASVGRFGLEVGGLALVLALVLLQAPGSSHQFYLCLLPLAWIALREGLPRTTLAVFLLNGTLAVGLAAREATSLVADAQVFMIVQALAALYLGAWASERLRIRRMLEQAYHAMERHLRDRTAALHEVRTTLQTEIAQREEAEATLHDSVAELRARRDELVRLNEKLRTSEEQLRDLNARKDKFFSIISHDVRSMLVSSIGFSKLLISDAETLPRDLIKEFASHVHSSTTNTYDLLENLLTWTRMQTGRMHYQREWHGVEDLIRNNVAMLQANAAQKGIELAREDETAPEVQVYADRNMINSVLQNLISNAIKFTERGGRVTVSARTYDSTVEISVSDTGVGISPENVEKLFRIDQHHSSSGTEDEEGTGLGLVLCREMIEKHDGKIWVESEIGSGSAFRFTLPCAVPAEVEPG